jgi:hypothetical protein
VTQIIKLSGVENTGDFLNLITDKQLVIFEDIQGSKIFVKYDGNKFIIKPKSLKNDPLNFIDLTVQKFYNTAFNYMHSLPSYVTDLLSKSWWFCFEYFPPYDACPANIEYSKNPRNNLILNCIVKGNKYKYDYAELQEYANLFDCDCLPVIFMGKLNIKQLEVINLFLHTSEDDLEFVFGESNFAKFFYDILNPQLKNSFLMHNDEFNDNLEKIIIKVDGNDDLSFEILNPLYKRMSYQNTSEHVEMYSLIILNFLEYCQLIDINSYKVKANIKDEIYIDLICQLFNEYMDNVKKNIDEWKINIPQFFKDEKFKINIDLLNNKKTIAHIKSDKKIEYIFKVILGTFNKRRKKPVGVFNEQTVEIFNNFVDKLNAHVDKLLNINREYNLQKSDLLNFNDYFKLSFNIDNGGKLYPDVYNKFKEVENGGEKKGKSKKSKSRKSPIPTKGMEAQQQQTTGQRP